MKLRVSAFASVLALLLVDAGAPSTAEACGPPPSSVLALRSPRRAIARSAKPSRVLLVSTKAAVLKRDLSAAGHRVEATPSSVHATGHYAVVVVDSNEEADKARSRFKESKVFVRSGDNREDLKTLEHVLSRRSDQVASSQTEKKTKLDAKQKDVPIDAGGGTGAAHVMVDAKQTTSVLDVAHSQAAVPPPAVLMSEEIQFSRGSARVAGSSQTIEKAVRWLSANPTARVTIEGHADPTGTPQGNLALGQTRAETVRDELVSAGIASSRIDVVTYGDQRLKYGPTDGRNRRVVIEAKR